MTRRDETTEELLTIPAFLRREPGPKKTRAELEREARALERIEARRFSKYWQDYNRTRTAELERKAKERSARARKLAKLPTHRLVFTDPSGQRVVTCGAVNPRKATQHELRVSCKKCQAQNQVEQ